MRITILGATGSTGAELLTRALQRDIDVTALVRDPTKITVADPRLQVLAGDATDVDALATALNNCDAVLSALGSGRSRSSDIASRAAEALLVAARRAGVERVIWLSALGVGASVADGSGLQRLVWKAAMRELFADKAVADEAIATSGLRYTLVYPTTLSNKPGNGSYTAAAHVRAGMKPISRGAVAQFMLDQLDSDRWINATAELAA